MSNAEKRKEIKSLLVGLAAYLQVNLTGELLNMYASDLEDLPVKEIAIGIKRYRLQLTENYGRFPFPGMLRSFVPSQPSAYAKELIEERRKLLEGKSNNE
jgi:hypothetical protein